MDARQEIKSLKKALRVLKVMNEKGDATVTDIAAAIGVPRTTAYRLLETFATEGYIERQPHSLYYRLTSKVLQLGAEFYNVNLLLEVAGPLFSDRGARVGRATSPSTPRAAEMVNRMSTNHDVEVSRDRIMNRAAPRVLTVAGNFCPAFCTELERENHSGLVRASGDPLRSRGHEN